MTERRDPHQLELGLELTPIELAAGDWITWQRDVGKCHGRIRGVYAGGITADRAEVLRLEAARGHERPRTKPHFIDPRRERVVKVAPKPAPTPTAPRLVGA